jgi:folylpolyglutamate synthase/dihydropteroate synthase
MEATRADAYRVLDARGWTGREQRRWIRYLIAYDSAHNEEQAKRMAHKSGKKG